MRLRKFMQAPVFACSPGATVAMAAREMEAHNVGSLVVTDQALFLSSALNSSPQ